MDETKDALRQKKCTVKIFTSDLSVPSDRTEFVRNDVKTAHAIVLCSSCPSERLAVETASEELDVPWVKAQVLEETASLCLQFFKKDVVDVFGHDAVAAPILQHI